MEKKKYCALCRTELLMRFRFILSRTVCPNCGTVYITRRSLSGTHDVYHCHFPKGYMKGAEEND